MLETFKKAIQLTKKNIMPVVWFQILFAAGTFAVFIPLYIGFIKAAQAATGLSYVSNENLGVYLTNPFVILMMAAAVLIAAFFILVQGASIISLFEAGYRGRSVTTLQLFLVGLKKAKQLVKPKNLLIITYFLLYLPVLFTLSLTGIFSFFKIPELITSFIWGTPWMTAVVFCGTAAALVLIVAWIFAPLCFALEDASFLRSVKKGVKVMRGHIFKTLLYVLVWNALLLAAALVLYLALIFIAALFVLATRGPELVLAAMLTLINMLNLIITILFLALIIPHNVSLLSVLYFRYTNTEERPIYEFESPLDKRKYRMNFASRVFATLAVPILVLFSYFSLTDFAGQHTIGNIFEQTPALIAAHRGDSKNAPENTMAGIRSAVEYLADCAEIDVQQTMDGVVVLSHDRTLKRVTGVDQPVWEMTYEEVRALDAGSWFSPEFAGEPIPTLEEVLQFAQFRIRLNIEIKYEEFSPSLVPAVISLVTKYRMQADCVISTFKREVLRSVKRIAPDIRTCYLSFVAGGDIEEFPEADAFSIESSFVSRDLVRRVHAKGKQIYVWTVNSEERLNAVAALNVDMVITDDPVQARKVIYAEKIDFWGRLLLEIFK